MQLVGIRILLLLLSNALVHPACRIAMVQSVSMGITSNMPRCDGRLCMHGSQVLKHNEPRKYDARLTRQGRGGRDAAHVLNTMGRLGVKVNLAQKGFAERCMRWDDMEWMPTIEYAHCAYLPYGRIKIIRCFSRPTAIVYYLSNIGICQILRKRECRSPACAGQRSGGKEGGYAKYTLVAFRPTHSFMILIDLPE